MYRFMINLVALPLWASPGNSIFDEVLRSSGWRGQRRSTSLVPAYSIYGAIEDPPAPPARPIPTDVPVKEPLDVPLRSPRDVPPSPEPERKTPTSEPHDMPPGPQTRPIP